MSPASTTMVKASSRLLAWLPTITAMATVIGAVGPEMSAGAPPNTAATKPLATALYRPAIGPAPAATP